MYDARFLLSCFRDYVTSISIADFQDCICSAITIFSQFLRSLQDTRYVHNIRHHKSKAKALFIMYSPATMRTMPVIRFIQLEYRAI